MNCERVRLLLNGYIDDALDLVSIVDIEEHLQHCSACSMQYQMLRSLHRATSSKALYYRAPAGLEKKIRSSLHKANPRPTAWPVFSWAWVAPVGLLVVVALFFLAAAQFHWLTPDQPVSLVQQVETAHVRSLMGSHLFDIASSDQHTVKPWFNGKLDFSPPVVDLAQQGFPLIGGRLDYLDGQPVAALVYQRNKHIINVFIWPSNETASSAQPSSYHGYYLLHWTQSGMTFWAVSDLNTAELRGFIQEFRNSTQ